MPIDDAIQTLTRIYLSIGHGIPKTAASPNALIDHLNDLYSQSSQDLNIDELFEYNDVVSPSITLTVRIDVEFDLKKVMENMLTRLHAAPRSQVDEIGRKGIVWSHGRYDFLYDDDAGLLQISHKFSHRRKDTKSVLSIVRKMISYAKNYLEEVKKSGEESTGVSETE